MEKVTLPKVYIIAEMIILEIDEIVILTSLPNLYRTDKYVQNEIVIPLKNSSYFLSLAGQTPWTILQQPQAACPGHIWFMAQGHLSSWSKQSRNTPPTKVAVCIRMSHPASELQGWSIYMLLRASSWSAAFPITARAVQQGPFDQCLYQINNRKTSFMWESWNICCGTHTK